MKKEIITNINNSPYFWIIQEVWAGNNISGNFYHVDGTSKTVYTSLVPYHKNMQRVLLFDWWADEQLLSDYDSNKLRSVSNHMTEWLGKALMNLYVDHASHRDVFVDKKPFILTSSFQVSKNLPETVGQNTDITHGWFTLTQPTENWLDQRSFHTTLRFKSDREWYIKTVWDIGVEILNLLVDPQSPITSWNIDQIIINWYADIYQTLKHVNENSLLVVTKEWRLSRLEDIIRTPERWIYKDMIVYKWSFNPVHNYHVAIEQYTKNKYPQHQSLLCFSADTYEKWRTTTEHLLWKIQTANKAGYDVLVTGSGWFESNIDLIQANYNSQIIFPMGVDTYERVLQSTGFPDRDNVHYEVVGRSSKEFEPTQENIHKADLPECDVSSTSVRAAAKIWDKEALKTMIPEVIVEDVIEVLGK